MRGNEMSKARSGRNINKHLFATFILRGKGLNPQEVTDFLELIRQKVLSVAIGELKRKDGLEIFGA